jgi:hypothetical protein
MLLRMSSFTRLLQGQKPIGPSLDMVYVEEDTRAEPRIFPVKQYVVLTAQ